MVALVLLPTLVPWPTRETPEDLLASQAAAFVEAWNGWDAEALEGLCEAEGPAERHRTARLDMVRELKGMLPRGRLRSTAAEGRSGTAVVDLPHPSSSLELTWVMDERGTWLIRDFALVPTRERTKRR